MFERSRLTRFSRLTRRASASASDALRPYVQQFASERLVSAVFSWRTSDSLVHSCRLSGLSERSKRSSVVWRFRKLVA